MNDFFDLNVRTLLTRLACAIVLGVVIAWRPLSRRPLKTDVKHALLIMTVASSMLMFVIGESTARAFGVVGLGSFIRFRSSIKDPRDVVQFFLAIGTGMACGHGALTVAAVGVATVWALLVVLDWNWKPPPAPNPAWDEEGSESRESVGIRG
jgi:cytochrome c biogenesis factor